MTALLSRRQLSRTQAGCRGELQAAHRPLGPVPSYCPHRGPGHRMCW